MREYFIDFAAGGLGRPCNDLVGYRDGDAVLLWGQVHSRMKN